MDQVTTEYYTITAESMARERERLYEKARHDEAQALHHAEQEGFKEGYREGSCRVEIARRMKAFGMPFDYIAQFTDLSYSEIERL